MQICSGSGAAVHIIKMETGEDMLETLNRAVNKQRIQHAAIVSGVGSISKYHLHVVRTTNIPPGNVYFKDNGAYDILTVTGYVMAGRVHAHLTVSDQYKAIGGHLEEGCTVLTFAIVTVVEVNGIDATDLDSF